MAKRKVTYRQFHRALLKSGIVDSYLLFNGKTFWEQQYEYYMAGVRDVVMHDSTLAIMCALENEEVV